LKGRIGLFDKGVFEKHKRRGGQSVAPALHASRLRHQQEKAES